MANILAIGIATLDIINTIDSYPPEDAEVRAISQHQSRGGNATNTLVVLNQLGHHCSWGGVLINEPDSHIIQQDLAQHHIDIRHCHRLAAGKMPTSYITLSQQTGSRSIVHHRDCPEFSFADFQKIDLNHFDWLHFEGRNVDQTRLMLEWVQSNHPNLSCSVEIEKPREDIASLFNLPTVLMFSQHYAEQHGHKTAEALLQSLASHITATCTWGKDGAWARDNNNIFHCPAFPPVRIIDTLGAGDTFNAGLIDSLVKEQPIDKALEYACRLAGIKCGQHGFNNLIL